MISGGEVLRSIKLFTLFFDLRPLIVVRPDGQNTLSPRFPQDYLHKLKGLDRSAKAHDDVVAQRKEVTEQGEEQKVGRP
jgi:hypothetical protein